MKVKTLKDLSSNASSLKLNGRLHQDFASLLKINKPPSITQEKVDSDKLRKRICNKLLLEYSVGKTLIQPTQEKCSEELDDLPLRGWLLHSSDKDPKERRHFWKFEDDLITLFLSESESLFYEQIPLSNVVKVKKDKNDQRFHLLLSGVQITVSSDGKDRDRCKQVINRWCNALMKAQAEAKMPKKTADDQGLLNGHHVKRGSKGIFHDIQFALNLDGSTFEAKKQLRELITSNGGQISYIITRNTKYLVVCEELRSGKSVSYKHRKALKLGIPVVSENFIRGSVEQGNLPKIDFSGQKSNENFSRGKISAPVLPSKPEKVEKFHIKKVSKYKIDDGDCPNFPEEFHVAKYSILRITGKTTKIVCVEAQIATLGQNDDISRVFRVMVSSKVATEKVSRVVYPVASICDLVKCYEVLVRMFQAGGMTRSSGVSDPEFCDVVSEPLGMIMSEMKSSSGIIHPEVIRLIESVWTDSIGELKMDMGVDPENIKLDQIRNAMIVLLKIEKALKNEKFTQKLSDEFYKYITLRNAHDKIPIDSIKKVAKKRELCQLLKDIISTNENSWLSTKMSSSYSQYLALNCAIAWVDPQGNEFKTVKDMLPDQSSDLKYKIRNIYKIGRAAENFEFRQDLGNKKLLFHASAAINFVGIFSRGLLMPLSATSELGIERRDEGKLGSGIYFSDSFQTSSDFATTSQSRGTRLMLINEVALGDVYETEEEQHDLKSPPEGFQSVKGIGLMKKGCNEYAVYNTNQQRMRYVIEFTLNDEMAVGHDTIPMSVFFEDARKEGKEISETSENMEPPLKDVQYGLVIESKGASAKLEEVHIRAKVIDLVSEVTLFQSYINMAHDKVEAKYVFPLADNAAVCGFEAFINEKHVVGEVKEKEEAHREYKKAVAEGHGAYLMDEEKPNVFTVSVGNIPPRARVVIKITYIVELETVDEPDSCVLFTLPGNIAKWNIDSTLMSSSITQSTTKSVAVSKGKKSSLMLSVDMPFDILDVVSPTHNIVSKKTATKACVKLQKTEFLGDNDFRLLIKVSEIHVPRIWIETDENEKNGEQVAMVSFFPEFDFDASENSDCTIFLDMSNSMAGTSAFHSKYISRLLIDKLPEKSRFNVVAFGSNFEESFAGFEKASDEMKENAKNFILAAEPCRGGSDLLPVLNSVNLLLENMESGRVHNIFLVSDGHLTDSERVLSLSSQISKSSFSQTRIFTLGIGNSINSHLLQSLSISTGGHHEHFSPSTKNTWKAQLHKQMSFAAQPALTDVHIDWCNYEDAESSKKTFLHVPEQVKCVFSGSRLTAYSFLPGCTKATLNAKIRGKEFSTVITAHGLSNVKGKTLHRLAAKAIFKEYESGRLAEDGYVDQVIRDQRKSQIISLSIKHSVVSKFTSFVAVEKRKETEDLSITSGPPVCELVEAAFEDITPEIGWGFEGLSPEENIDELLKRSSQMQTSSILRARDLALEAKNLCDDLPEPDVIRRLQVSAALCRMNATPQNFDAFKELETALAPNLSDLNYDLLNSISRKGDSLTTDAIQDLADAFWPDHCTVQLSSLPEKLRPFVVGLYVMCCNFEDMKFAQSSEAVAKFWEEIRNIQMRGNDDVTSDVVLQLKNIGKNIKLEEVRKRQIIFPGLAKCAFYRKRKNKFEKEKSSEIVPDLAISIGESHSDQLTDLLQTMPNFESIKSLAVEAPYQKKKMGHPRQDARPLQFSPTSEVKRASMASVTLHSRSSTSHAYVPTSPSYSLNKLTCRTSISLSAAPQHHAFGKRAEYFRASPAPNLQSDGLDVENSERTLRPASFAAPSLAPAFRKEPGHPMSSMPPRGVPFGSTTAGSLFGSITHQPANAILSDPRLKHSVARRDFPTPLPVTYGGGGFGALQSAPLPKQGLGSEDSWKGGVTLGDSLQGIPKARDTPQPTVVNSFCDETMLIAKAPRGKRVSIPRGANVMLSTPSGGVSFGSTAGPLVGSIAQSSADVISSQCTAQQLAVGRNFSTIPQPPPIVYGDAEFGTMRWAPLSNQHPRPENRMMGGFGFGSAQPVNSTEPMSLQCGSIPVTPPPVALQATVADNLSNEITMTPPLGTYYGYSAAVQPSAVARGGSAFDTGPRSDLPPLTQNLLSDGYCAKHYELDQSSLFGSTPSEPMPTTLSSQRMPRWLSAFGKPTGPPVGGPPSDGEVHRPSAQLQCAAPPLRPPRASNTNSQRLIQRKSERPEPLHAIEHYTAKQARESKKKVVMNPSERNKLFSSRKDERDYFEGLSEFKSCGGAGAEHEVCDVMDGSSSDEERRLLDELIAEIDSSVEELISEVGPATSPLIKLLCLSEAKALDECLSRMEEEGFWRFPNDDEIGQHDANEGELKMLKICKEIVISAGGRSLGLNCLAVTLNMLLTSIMILVLKHIWDNKNLVRVRQKIASAEKWLKQAEETQPLLYSRLELGSSWEAAAHNVMSKIAADLCS